MPDNRTVEFGSNKAKATNAGSIGYQLTTPNALDVYGGGTTVGSRNLQLWDNVTVPGSLHTGVWDVGAALATFGKAVALFPSPPGPVSNNTGEYVITASSNADSAYSAFTATGWYSAAVYGGYTNTGAATTPATTQYTTMSDSSSSSTTSTVTGEWVQIQLPCPLSLMSWQIAAPNPQTTYVLSSFDGITWYSCCSSSSTTTTPTICEPQIYSKQSFTYFRLVSYIDPSTYQATSTSNGALVAHPKNATVSNIWLGGVGKRKLVKWTPLALASGVGTYQNSVPSYSKDALGVVRLRGMMSIPSGTNITLATLPPLCRPMTSNGTIMQSYSNNAFCIVQIDANGVITIISGASTTFLSLNNLHFDTTP